MRAGRPVHVQTPAEMAERFPELVDVPALVTFPLITAGEPLGVLLIDFKGPRSLDEGERDLLEALATQCAIALARAQLYERERDVAQTLQASLLPRKVPEIRAWTSRPSSWPARRGSTSAATSTTRSRSRRANGGSRSATCAARAWTRRHSPHSPATPCAPRRSRARAEPRPARPEPCGAGRGAVGAVPDRDLRRLRADESDGSRTDGGLRWAPAARCCWRRTGRQAARCTGTLLGVLDDPLVHDVEAVLAPGDTLLLYADGLTEAGAPARTLSHRGRG